ncbi:5'-3' exonuclease H3TH domain-containing protein, partial [Clostridium sp.]|uniref:5'-3' exonuclease H3TH domain-containing protein n=1 Tax=Clostridium sp. TaxID=1506 RepID=UPI00346432E6
MERLLILDSNSLMNRAYYALPLLSNSEGIHTNAVLGFTSMLFKMKEEINPDYIVATFDRKAPTFRHVEYKDYKAGRKKMPPELAEQFPIVKDMLKLLDINIFEIDGFEADDLIGTLANHAEKNNMEVYIVTGDKDALQLATKNIKVVITKKGITEKVIYDEDAMIEEYGITPKEFIDVKGLMGDTSDNIPGVPGVGEKTAIKLIKTYGSVEGVLENLEEISGKKLKENLMEYREQAIFSKKLATIMTEVPVEIDLEEIKSKKNLDIEGVRQLFYKLQFKSLLDKLPKSENIKEEEENIETNDIKTLDHIKSFKEYVGNEELYLTFNIEGTSKYSSLNLKELYIRAQNTVYFINMDSLEETVLKELKDILEDDKIKKIAFDVKSAYSALGKRGIALKNLVFDVKIAAYLVDASKGDYEAKVLINEYLHRDVQGEDKDIRIKETFYLKDLYEAINKKILEGGMEKLLYDIELPLTKVLSNMESIGFKVNRDILDT